MLERFGKKEPSIFDAQIAKILEEMQTYGPTDPEYKQMVKYLERFAALKTGERREKIKSDTLLIVGGNVLVTLIIVGYERNHAVVTKVWSFLNKPKI